MKGDNKAEPKDIRQEKDEKIEKISQVLIWEVEVNYSHKYWWLTSYKIILKNWVIVWIKYKDIWWLRKKVWFREYVDKTTWSLRKWINPSTYIQSRAEFDNLKAFVEEVCKSYHKSLANS
jgi:hypothetical protein